jgi:hypothetical protein
MILRIDFQIFLLAIFHFTFSFLSQVTPEIEPPEKDSEPVQTKFFSLDYKQHTNLPEALFHPPTINKKIIG